MSGLPSTTPTRYVQAETLLVALRAKQRRLLEVSGFAFACVLCFLMLLDYLLTPKRVPNLEVCLEQQQKLEALKPRICRGDEKALNCIDLKDLLAALYRKCPQKKEYLKYIWFAILCSFAYVLYLNFVMETRSIQKMAQEKKHI